MSGYKSDFLNVLAERGFIHQVSEPDALDQFARSQAVTAYIGFDCTAASLHVGSLLPIMMLYWLQQTGHRPIALMGGGTTRVGDPSGKDESRRILTDEMINQNLAGIRSVFSKFLRFESEGGNAPHDSIFQRLAANANHGHRHDGHDCRLKTVKDCGYPGEIAIGGVNEAQCPKDKDRWYNKESAGNNPTQGFM